MKVEIVNTIGTLATSQVGQYASMLPHLLVAYSNLIAAPSDSDVDKPTARATFSALVDEICRVYNFDIIVEDDES